MSTLLFMKTVVFAAGAHDWPDTFLYKLELVFFPFSLTLGLF